MGAILRLGGGLGLDGIWQIKLSVRNFHLVAALPIASCKRAAHGMTIPVYALDSQGKIG